MSVTLFRIIQVVQQGHVTRVVFLYSVYFRIINYFSDVTFLLESDWSDTQEDFKSC